jgi:hypothetical protein
MALYLVRLSVLLDNIFFVYTGKNVGGEIFLPTPKIKLVKYSGLFITAISNFL